MTDKVPAALPATREQLEGYGDHIVQYSPDYSLCAGCETCAIMCGLTHFGVTGPHVSGVHVSLGTRDCIHTIEACLQCKDRPCYEACPKKGRAMCYDPDTDVTYVDQGHCIGCGKCMRACKFEPSRITLRRAEKRKGWRAVKCDLCRGKEGMPACIAYCPVRCIGLASDSVLVEAGMHPAEPNAL